jgi:hypothetical protein
VGLKLFCSLWVLQATCFIIIAIHVFGFCKHRFGNMSVANRALALRLFINAVSEQLNLVQFEAQFPLYKQNGDIDVSAREKNWLLD